jgi:lipoate-protein ligase A
MTSQPVTRRYNTALLYRTTGSTPRKYAFKPTLMRFLDLTLETPQANLALDEAILESAEQADEPTETLRLWESPRPFVVLGRSSRVAVEVDEDECHRRGLPILRRCSGGASVVAGPGCLMYALVLSFDLRPELRMISEAHCFVAQNMMAALRPLVPQVQFRGTCDLTVEDKKFSGNSLRIKRSCMLYHGTLLVNFPLELISTCLRTPPRQPDYRQGREHDAFVTNLGVPTEGLRQAIVSQWQAHSDAADWPRTETEELIRQRYSQRTWNYRF